MRKVPTIPGELNQLFPAEWIRQTSQTLAVFVRQCKVDPVALFWSVVLAPTALSGLTIAGMQRVFEAMAGVTLASSAYQKRLDREFSRLLEAAVTRGLELVRGKERGRAFSQFADVLAIDSTLIKVKDALSNLFPGPRTNTSPAAVKVNATYSVVRGMVHRIAVSAGKTAEVKFLKFGEELRGVLLLFDLGYFSSAVFHQIDRCGGFFVSRLKANANPRIVEDLGTGSGRRRDLVGKKLKAALPGLGRDTLDVIVEVRVPRPKRKKTDPAKPRRKPARQAVSRFRVVGVRHPQTGELHLYLTNVPAATFDPEQVRVAYSARWLVELLFNELKNDCHLDQMPSRRPEVVEALIYAALLRLLVAKHTQYGILARFLQQARDQEGQAQADFLRDLIDQRASTKRFLRTFNLLGPYYLLHEVLALAGIDSPPLEHFERLLLNSMIDPNIKRDKLATRIRTLVPSKAA
jgi:IS4 transposase